jgi:hypothetical protein
MKNHFFNALSYKTSCKIRQGLLKRIGIIWLFNFIIRTNTMNIGILGLGTVGGGVVNVLAKITPII